MFYWILCILLFIPSVMFLLDSLCLVVYALSLVLLDTLYLVVYALSHVLLDTRYLVVYALSQKFCTELIL